MHVLDLACNLSLVLSHNCESLEGLNDNSFKLETRPLGSEFPGSLLVVHKLTPSVYQLVLQVEVQYLPSTLLLSVFVEAVGPVPEIFLVSHPHYLIMTSLRYCPFPCVLSESI